MLLSVATAAIFQCCINVTAPSGCGFECDITKCISTPVESPGYPVIWNKNETCTWKIFSTLVGTAIQFTMDHMSQKGVSLKIYSGAVSDGVVLYPNPMNITTIQSCVNVLTITYSVNVSDAGLIGGFSGTAAKCGINSVPYSGCCDVAGLFSIDYSGGKSYCYATFRGTDHQLNQVTATYGGDQDYILGFTFSYQSNYDVVFNFSKDHSMDDTHLLFPEGYANNQFIYFHSPSKSMKFSGVMESFRDGEISISVSSNGDYSYVYSPNHPDSYISGMSCVYNIQTNDMMVVRITVEENELTAGDTLTICRDLETYQCYAGKVDGTISWYTSVNSSYVSNTSSFTIFFDSDALGQNYQKFKLRLEAIYPPSSFACGSSSDMAGMESAVLHSPDYPKILNGSQTCRWTMKVWPGTTIKFSVLDFNSTNGVTLKIYSGDSDSGSVLYPKGTATTVSSCSGIATVIYNVDIPSFSGPIRGGFYARVTNDRPDSSCCLDTSYSTVSYSKAQEDCTVQITGKTALYVQLDNVQVMYHDNMDYIVGYTLDTYTVSDYTQIFRYSKNNTFNGSSLFLPYSSSIDTYVYFHSPSQEFSFSGTLAYTGGKCHETIVLGSSSDVKYLFSPNYPDKYIPQMDCIYDVHAPSGKVVKVTVMENHLAISDIISVCSDSETVYCFSRNTVGTITFSTSNGHNYKSGHSKMTIFFKATAATSSSSMTFKLKLQPITPSLSTGTIIGIVVACIIGVAFVVVIVVAIVVYRRNGINRSGPVQAAPVHYTTPYPQFVAYGGQPQYGQQPGGFGVYPNQPVAYPNTETQPQQTVPGFQSSAT